MLLETEKSEKFNLLDIELLYSILLLSHFPIFKCIVKHNQTYNLEFAEIPRWVKQGITGYYGGGAPQPYVPPTPAAPPSSSWFPQRPSSFGEVY